MTATHTHTHIYIYIYIYIYTHVFLRRIGYLFLLKRRWSSFHTFTKKICKLSANKLADIFEKGYWTALPFLSAVCIATFDGRELILAVVSMLFKPTPNTSSAPLCLQRMQWQCIHTRSRTRTDARSYQQFVISGAGEEHPPPMFNPWTLAVGIRGAYEWLSTGALRRKN